MNGTSSVARSDVNSPGVSTVRLKPSFTQSHARNTCRLCVLVLTASVLTVSVLTGTTLVLKASTLLGSNRSL